MPTCSRLVAIAVIASLALPHPLSAADVLEGSWKFDLDRGDNPMLAYDDASGRTVFRIYCGTHFETDAVYPGAPKPEGAKVTITIGSGAAQMDFPGIFYTPDPPNITSFNQADLGFARDDSELYQDKWHAEENRVFDFLSSGGPLTISAEGKSYVLPPIDAPDWRPRFQKTC
jgi:hypothetical protein